MLPVVDIGLRSFHLYFFLIDALGLTAAVLWIVIIILDYRRRKSLSLVWVAMSSLLIFPLFGVYATYLDLTIGLP
jgi:hypothetical protein